MITLQTQGRVVYLRLEAVNLALKVFGDELAGWRLGALQEVLCAHFDFVAMLLEVPLLHPRR